MPRPRFNRILLKLSGEALMGRRGVRDRSRTRPPALAGEIAEAREAGHDLCLVVGGGNIFRGLAAAARGFDRTSADYMGMLATVMNALALQNALENIGVDTRVLSAIPMATVSEPYIRRRAMRHMEKGRVVIFAAGTGNPYLHHRYRRRPARRRDGLRRLVQGHQRRRRLRCRSEEGEGRAAATRACPTTRCWPTI